MALDDLREFDDDRRPLSAGFFIATTPLSLKRELEQKFGRPFEAIAREREAAASDHRAPMVRWSEDERLMVKGYLEGLPAGEWKAEDHYLMVEYLFQRYLPEDDQRTHGEWLEKRTELRAKIDANLKRIALGEPTPPPPPPDPDFASWLDNLFLRKR